MLLTDDYEVLSHGCRSDFGDSEFRRICSTPSTNAMAPLITTRFVRTWISPRSRLIWCIHIHTYMNIYICIYIYKYMCVYIAFKTKEPNVLCKDVPNTSDHGGSRRAKERGIERGGGRGLHGGRERVRA